MVIGLEGLGDLDGGGMVIQCVFSLRYPRGSGSALCETKCQHFEPDQCRWSLAQHTKSNRLQFVVPTRPPKCYNRFS